MSFQVIGKGSHVAVISLGTIPNVIDLRSILLIHEVSSDSHEPYPGESVIFCKQGALARSQAFLGCKREKG